MSGHTPGPWEVRGTMVYGQRDQSDNRPDYLVAEASNNNGWPQNVANARLIAAAPDLLEALEAIVHDDGVYANSVMDVEYARAAIAKAREEE